MPSKKQKFSPPSSADSAASPASPPAAKQRKKKPASRPNPQVDGHRQMRLPEAFRREGLDEPNLARQFSSVMQKLQYPKRNPKGNPKAHLDGLKEWIRVLADKPGAADDAPVMFQLVHSIPRPVRENPAAPSAAADDKSSSES